MSTLRCLLTIALLWFGCAARSEALDWAAFLSRSDLVWPKLPSGWNNGAFVGNGRLGSICWQGEDGALRFEVSRSDLYDHRSADQPGGWLFRTYRLPNGHLDLSWGQGKPSGTLRLDLWNAELSGTLSNAGSHPPPQTARGRISARKRRNR